jgi:ribosome recycling factor
LISEDDERRSAEEIDTLAKRFVDEADRIGKDKEQEVLEV